MNTLLHDQLCSLLDRHGLFAVLDGLSTVCGHRVEVAKNYTAFDDWTAAQEALDAAASKVLDLFREDNP